MSPIFGSPRVSQMRDERAVSTTLSYVLTLSIAAILVSGLLLAGGSYIDDRREAGVEDELTVIGQQLAAGLERADRLAVAGDSSSIALRIDQNLPSQVTGSGYRVSLDGSSEEINLESTSSDISVTVGFTSQTSVTDSSAQGGQIQIVYNSGALEVTNV